LQFKKKNSMESGSGRSNKVDLIIETAQKWFGLYGIEKTSMREIADDLKLSKASLYYYFPDKESLYIAVVEKEQNEFLSLVSESITKGADPEDILRNYSVKRLSYFRTLLNLSRLRLDTYSDLKPVIKETRRVFREKEKEIVLKIFRMGIKKGIFYTDNPDRSASLFLEILKGLRVSVVNDKNTMIIEQEEYDRLLENTVEFTEVFIKALKAKN
jgi:AcrR family transcriptional regulator